LFTFIRSGKVGRSPVIVSREYVNVLSGAFLGKEMGGSFPKATVGGGGGVGERRSLMAMPTFTIIKIISTADSKIPNNLRSSFVWDVAIVKVSIP